MKHLTVFFVLLLFLLGMNVAVGADFQKGAAKWTRLAAEHGHAKAQFNQCVKKNYKGC